MGRLLPFVLTSGLSEWQCAIWQSVPENLLRMQNALHYLILPCYVNLLPEWRDPVKPGIGSPEKLQLWGYL